MKVTTEDLKQIFAGPLECGAWETVATLLEELLPFWDRFEPRLFGTVELWPGSDERLVVSVILTCKYGDEIKNASKIATTILELDCFDAANVTVEVSARAERVKT